MTDQASHFEVRRRWALWVVVFTGSALRTSLLGALLVAESALGAAFELRGPDLALLVECSIFGGLLAVLLLPSMTHWVGIRALSIGSMAAAIALLATAILFAPDWKSDPVTKFTVFAVMGLLGFFLSVMSPVAQTLLNNATENDADARHRLQSVWSAGLPVGFIAASVVGGVLVELDGWTAALAVPLVLAVVSLLAFLGMGLIPPVAPHPYDKRPPISEIAVIVSALVAFEVWSTWGSLAHWLDPGVLLSMLATVGITALAVAKLRKSTNQAISLAPYSVGSFAAATLIMLLYQFPTTAEFEVLLLGELDKVSSEIIGNRTAIGNAGQVAGTLLAAALLYRKQIPLALTAGFALTIVGLASYVLYPWVYDFTYIAATRTVTGLGGGLLTPVLFVIALHRMPLPLQLAAGTWLVLANIGGVEIGLALFDAVLEIAREASGSERAGYLTVEVGQLLVGVATAALTAFLALRGRLDVRGPQQAGPVSTTGTPTI